MSKSKKTTTSKTPKTKPAAKRSKTKAVASLAGPTQEQAQAAAEVIGQAPENAPAETPAPESNPEATDATVANVDATMATESATPARKTKAPKEPKAKKPSGLDAAAQVLKDKGEPMTCKDIMGQMLAKGLWTTNGKTPAATLYSAMLREIDGKPGESRFVKTGRGLFTLTGKN
jgi:flagellar biosynthesis GTPase FlhF